jgi:hypothetical protein
VEATLASYGPVEKVYHLCRRRRWIRERKFVKETKKDPDVCCVQHTMAYVILHSYRPRPSSLVAEAMSRSFIVLIHGLLSRLFYRQNGNSFRKKAGNIPRYSQLGSMPLTGRWISFDVVVGIAR